MVSKKVLILLGFAIGFLLSWQIREVNPVLLYLSYRIHGPKSLHAIEDALTDNPIPAISLIVVATSVAYIAIANARIKSENKKQKKKTTFPP